MDLSDKLVALYLNGNELPSEQKNFVRIQLAVTVFLFIFLMSMVFSPSTYNLNTSGIIMSRIAFMGLVVSMVMSGDKLVKDIAKIPITPSAPPEYA